MTRINTNVSSLIAQQSLATTETQLQTSMTRLSTGLQINSGADNPSGLIASQALQSNITSIGSALTNSQTAGEMISTADGAMSQVSTLLNTIRGLVTSSANTGALSSDQIAANQLQVDSALQAINQISQTTSFQGQKLIDGSLDFTTTAGAGDTAANVKNLQINQAIASTANPMAVNVAITSAATQATTTANIPAASGATKAKATLAFNGGADNMVVTDNTAGSAGNGIAVNIVESSAIDNTGATAQAQFTAGANGQGGVMNVFVSSTHTTAMSVISTAIAAATGAPANTFTTTMSTGNAAGVYTPGGAAVAATTAGAIDATGGITSALVFQLTGDQGSQVFNFSAGTSGADIAKAINLQTSSTGVSAVYGAAGSTNLVFTAQDYGSQGTIGIQTITDNTSEGVNSFASTLTHTNTSGADIVGTINGYTAQGQGNTLSVNTPSLAMSATVASGSSTGFAFNITGGGAVFQLGPDVQANEQTQLGIQAVTSGTLGNGNDGMLYTLGSGQTNSLANNPAQASKIINDAISQVANIRGRLGAFESETVDSNTAALNSTLTNLTQANSNIVDTDFASETANMTRSQILEQSGISVLSTANQQPQMVLKLLQ
jgi:flagellin